MTHLTLPTNEAKCLSFYLAIEEYAARHILSNDPSKENDSLFFLWQVEPTVIFGRHQVIENEVNLDYCREHGIRFYRRKSGGGAYLVCGYVVVPFKRDSLLTLYCL